MGSQSTNATNLSGESLPKGEGNAQDGVRKVPARWQNTERTSRAWREMESRTDGKD